MTNILSAAEAAIVLRCDATDARMLQLLPQIDATLQEATGHDWQNDSPITETAKAAARMLLVPWYEDPGMIGGINSIGFGLTFALAQLQALALNYCEFQGRSGAGPIDLPLAFLGDKVDTLVGVSGVTGDQSANFESVITVQGQIQQESTDDLSDNWYRVHFIPLGDQ